MVSGNRTALQARQICIADVIDNRSMAGLISKPGSGDYADRWKVVPPAPQDIGSRICCVMR
jgi:hypothetical protein